MTAMTDVLGQVPYFSKLDATLLKELTDQVRERRYKAGEVVLLEGDPCEGLYFVVSGRVKIFKVSGEGKEQVLRILGPGRTFNDVPVFDGGPNPGSVATLEPSTVGHIPKRAILALVEKHPLVAMAVIRLLATRLRALTLMIEDLSQHIRHGSHDRTTLPGCLKPLHHCPFDYSMTPVLQEAPR